MKLMYVVIMTALVLSCQSKNNEPLEALTQKTELADIGTAADSTQSPEGNTGSADKKKQDKEPVQKSDGSVADWTQKIIKTANINLELKDYHTYNNTLHQSLAAYGAYIAQEQQQQDEAQITNDLSIKVPVDKFESLVNFLTADRKNKVLQKQITSADVTAEYADTKARLETRKQVREKYHQFMSNANKIDDVLRLQSEINTITEDIEAAAGRVKYLSHQAAYSTVNLRYYQVLDASKADEDKAPGFGSRVLTGLRSGAFFIGELIVILVSVWPLWLVGFGVWYILKRKGVFRSASSSKP